MPKLGTELVNLYNSSSPSNSSGRGSVPLVGKQEESSPSPKVESLEVQDLRERIEHLHLEADGNEAPRSSPAAARRLVKPQPRYSYVSSALKELLVRNGVTLAESKELLNEEDVSPRKQAKYTSFHASTSVLFPSTDMFDPEGQPLFRRFKSV